MKRYLLVFVFSVSFFCLYSQCTIDYNYIPNGANYGLDPDSLPFTDEKTFDLLSRGDLEETQSVLEKIEEEKDLALPKIPESSK